MGPTNVALVRLFRADQALREAQSRLDAAAKNVRVQQRRVNDLAEKLKLAQTKLREDQARSAELDLDLQSRDAHIEKLRAQQQQTKNNKEYQVFLMEISTAKVDRGKVEDEAMKALETVEREQQELAALQALVHAEEQKLESLQAQSQDTVKAMQAEVEAARPARDEAAAEVPSRAREAFERLAEHHEGEAMAALAKPDRRREEYVCTACMLSLVADVYNKLHTRDEIVFCPSCRRILYIPEDLPPETAINPRAGAKRTTRSAAEKAAEPRAKGKWGELLTAAQGESVKAAVDAAQAAVDLRVSIDGELAGHYKGKSRENFERIVQFRMGEAGMSGTVVVEENAAQPAAEQSEAEINPA